ncbi:MAG: lamin tail domain-containing protein [Chloroflexi bacterium]|nr:lamin tail domain-containing protein [Chloroflexota bacterium]
MTGAAPPPAGPLRQLVAGAVTPGPATLRLSEVLSDPPQSGRDAAFEWVELVNTGTEPVDLTGWVIEDGSARDPLPAAIVPPGGYVVIAGKSASFPPDVIVVTPADGDIGNGLGNTGDRLRLIAPGGTVVDEMTYGDNTSVFDPAPPAPPAGRTIGLLDPLADPGGDSWALTLTTTPGAPNVFPPRAQETEIPALTSTPNASDPEPPAVPLSEESSGGGSVAPWMVLGGILGISAGMAGAAFGPRVRRAIEARRAR